MLLTLSAKQQKYFSSSFGGIRFFDCPVNNKKNGQRRNKTVTGKVYYRGS